MEGKILILLVCIALGQCEWVKEMESKIFSIFDIHQVKTRKKQKRKEDNHNCTTMLISGKCGYLKVTFARNFAKKLNSSFYYFNLLFQLSVVNPENFKEIIAWEALKFLKTKQEFWVTVVIWPNHYGNH